MNLFKQFGRIHGCRVLESLTAFVMGVGAVALLTFSTPGLPGVDGYYHIQIARLTRMQGILHEFPWTQQSIFLSGFADKELLFHMFLVPFAGGDLITGAKVASCFLGGILFLVFHFSLQAQGCRFPLLWTLVLLGSGPVFLYRMALPRPHVLSLLLLLLTAYCLHRRRCRSLAVLGFVYAWSYAASHLILILAILFNLSLLLARKRPDLRTLLYTAGGLVLGLLSHPHFPHHLTLWYVQTVLAPFHAWGVLQGQLVQGAEMLPPSGRLFATGMAVPSLVLVSGLLGYLWKGQQPGERTWMWLSYSLFFLGLTLLSVRFAEYWVPFTLQLGASVLTDWMEACDSEPGFRWPRSARWSVPVVFLILSEAATTHGILKAQASLTKDGDSSMAEACAWLNDHLPPGEIIFHTEWDDFPKLFFYAPRQYYLVGLDPVFMWRHDRLSAELWMGIGDGRRADFAALVKDRFHSRYLFVRHGQRRALERLLRRSPQARLRYRNSAVSVYEL
ncbi:MAG: hypothetical protein HYU36_07370 [Planctomycetes bacterium]|nr:hypothetical protein [Planctomycetota bacterium]